MSLYIKKKKRFLRKSLVGAFLFLIGLLGFFLTRFVLDQFFPQGRPIHPLFAVLMTTLLFVIAFKPLDQAITQLFKHYFFKRKSYAHINLMNLARDLSQVLDLKELSNLIVNTFGEVLHLNTVTLVLRETAESDFKGCSGYGWKISDLRSFKFSDQSPIVQLIHESGRHVIVRDLVVRALSWQDANNLSRDFDTVRGSWVIPLHVEENLIGFLAFSSAETDSQFDEADFHFFREFSELIAKWLQNAMHVDVLKKANEELRDAQSELLQATKLSAIEQLATGIAHEVHNPLTIISGKAQVLLLQKDRTPLDERVEDVLKTIVKQTKRAADITRKLLMFSQGSGSLKEKVRLEQVLQDTIALVSYQSSLEGIELKQSISPSIRPIWANVHEIREVFLNLILNAVQSVDADGKIEMVLRDCRSENCAEFQISDTGKGIEESKLYELFNPFYTTCHESVGLGLFVTRQIVHRYGGSVRVESELGRGSLFMVKLPYSSQETEDESLLVDEEENAGAVGFKTDAER